MNDSVDGTVCERWAQSKNYKQFSNNGVVVRMVAILEFADLKKLKLSNLSLWTKLNQ